MVRTFTMNFKKIITHCLSVSMMLAFFWILVLDTSMTTAINSPTEAPTGQNNENVSIVCVVSAWGMNQEDITWLESLPYPIVAYNKDFRPTINNLHRTEAGKYVHFMCKHYDMLPDLTIFLHGHEKAWHRSPDIIVDLISKIEEGRSNPQKLLADFAYFSFSSVIWSDEEIFKIFPILNHTWTAFLGKYFLHPLEYYGDFIVGNNCCSEFIVSSTRIRTRPRELWCDFFQFLNNAVGVRMIVPIYKELSDEKVKGMIFEWFVPLLFGSFH